MSVEKEDVNSGVRTINDWIRDRFPEAKITYLGQLAGTPRYRWMIDFGKTGFRLGATEPVLASPTHLKQRLHELEEGKWLSNADVEDKWVVLNKVCITPWHRDEW